MAMSFELDMSKLRRAISQSPEAAGNGAKQALGDIKDDWVRQSRDVAPLDTGNLRRQIHGEVKESGLGGQVVVSAPAMSKWKGRPFNYAYYIHEENAGGKSLQTPGTVKKFFDESGKEQEAKWQRWLEDDVEAELKRKGW
jgi:hypothetical protein